MDLFPHNRQAYDAACRLLAETGKAAVIHPTGTGKSFIGFQLCQDRPEDRVCWLAPGEQRWQAGYTAAREYYRQHGRLDVKANYVTEQGYPLGSWLYEQKRRYRVRTLKAERRKALEAISFAAPLENTDRWERKA